MSSDRSSDRFFFILILAFELYVCWAKFFALCVVCVHACVCACVSAKGKKPFNSVFSCTLNLFNCN